MQTARALFVQRIKTTNDVNGNGRRLWLCYGAAGEILEVWRESHAGRPAATAGAVALEELTVTGGEYQRIKRWAAARDLLRHG